MYKVICVTDRHLVKGNFQTQIEKVLEQKPWALILREKDLDEERYAALAAEILPLCKKAGVLCLFRGHLKLAERMGADGVQISIEEARKLQQGLGTGPLTGFPWTGISVHSTREAEEAEKLGADFVIYGHVFATQCKPGLAPKGLSRLHTVCSGVKLPVFAIGGIDEEKKALCAAAGAAGVCMMSGFMTM